MSTDGDARVSEILERATAFYESLLWESDGARAIRSFLVQRDLDEETLRAFRVGYAPIGWFGLQEHMSRWQYSPDELRAAGLVQQSHRSERMYDYFRSRIIFPVGDSRGRVLGFAGLAPHPGPSWPKWLTSPESPRYRRGSAVFGIDRAASAIRAALQAVVLNDCLDVLEHHQRGQREAVAVIRSDITEDHVRNLAAAAGATPTLATGGSTDFTPPVTIRLDRAAQTARAAAEADAAANLGSEGSYLEAGTTAGDRRAGPHRRAAALVVVLLMIVLSFAMWIAIPLGWLWIGSQLSDTPQPSASVTFIVGAGLAVSMATVGYVLARMNRLYRRLIAVERAGPRVHVAWLKSLRTSDEQYDRGLLDVIMISSAGIALLAMAVWFFLFAGAPI